MQCPPIRKKVACENRWDFCSQYFALRCAPPHIPEMYQFGSAGFNFDGALDRVGAHSRIVKSSN